MIKITCASRGFQVEHLQESRRRFDAIVEAAGFDAIAETGVEFADDLIIHLKTNLKKILVGLPTDLLQVIDDIEQRFPNFSDYCARRPSSRSRFFNASMSKLCGLVERLFSYAVFSSKATKNGAYALVREYNQRLCPYCQLHHANYHVDAGKNKLTMRPPLDHFYPQTKYPYLAISLSNLIPSCHQCNTSVKGAKDPRTKLIPHPLQPLPPLSIDHNCRSALPPSRINSPDDFSIDLVGTDDGSKDFLDFFELVERYKWYGAEVMDLYRRYQRYMELEPALRATIRRSEYLLGFAPSDARERALGTILSGLATSLPEP